jgi:endonuclease-3 related protein
MYNEYHALLVYLGKHYCRKTKPQCRQCPLLDLLPDHGPLEPEN